MTPLILATALQMTLPAFNADIPKPLQPEYCRASVMPLSDLSRVRLYGAPTDGPVRMILDMDVRGCEGCGLTVIFEDGSRIWTLWVTTVDFSGNESCRSNQIGINLGPGIPDPTHPGPDRR